MLAQYAPVHSTTNISAISALLRSLGQISSEFPGTGVKISQLSQQGPTTTYS